MNMMEGQTILRTFYCLLLLVISFVVQAESVDLATLRLALSKAENEIDKIDLQIKIAGEFLSSDKDSSLFYIDKSLEQSMENEYTLGIGRSMYLKGRLYDYNGKHKKAQLELNSAMKLFVKENSILDRANVLNQLGTNRRYAGKYDSARLDFQAALALYKELNDLDGEAIVYSNLGIVEDYTGNYPKALEYYFKAVKFYEAENNKDRICLSFINISTVYYFMQDMERAIEFQLRSNEISREVGDKLSLTRGLGNLATYYNESGRIEEGIQACEEGIAVAKEIGNVKMETNHLTYKASAHFELQEYKKSKKFYSMALAVMKNEKSEDKEQFALINLNLGQVCEKLEDFTDGEKYFQEALKIANESKIPNVQLKVYEGLSSFNENRKRYSTALQFHKGLMQIKDTIFNKEKVQALVDVEAKYENEKSERQIVEQKLALEQGDRKLKRTKFQRSIASGGAFTLLLFSILLLKNLKLAKNNSSLKEERNYYLNERNKELETKISDLSEKIIVPESIKQPKAGIVVKPIDLKATKIMLKNKTLVSLDEIILVRAAANYVEIVMMDSTIKDRQNLKEFKEQLPDKLFVQIHRSNIINSQKVKVRNANSLIMINDEMLNVTSTYKDSVNKILDLFVQAPKSGNA